MLIPDRLNHGNPFDPNKHDTNTQKNRLILPSSTCVELARELHYLYCKHANIYNSDSEIKTSWDSDSRDRGIWYDRAQELGNILIGLGWKLPS